MEPARTLTTPSLGWDELKTEAEADDPAAALLRLSVIDPACGSGHFLLAARLAIGLLAIGHARPFGALAIGSRARRLHAKVGLPTIRHTRVALLLRSLFARHGAGLRLAHHATWQVPCQIVRPGMARILLLPCRGEPLFRHRKQQIGQLEDWELHAWNRAIASMCRCYSSM